MITIINTKFSGSSKFETSQFTEKSENNDWSSSNSNGECHIHFSKFYTLFKTICDGAFQPNGVKMLYRNHLPWLTGGLKESIKYKKNTLYRISFKHLTSCNISKHCKIFQIINGDLSQIKINIQLLWTSYLKLHH